MVRGSRSRYWGTYLLVSSLVLLVVAAFLVLRPKPAHHARPVLLVTGDWAPYVSRASGDQGPAARLVLDVLRASGSAPELTFASWPDAVQRAEDGTVLAVFPVADVDNRSRDFVLSDPLFTITYALFVDGTRTPADHDVSSMNIALIDGYEYWPALETSGATFTTFPTALRAFEALAEGKVDAVAEDILAGRAVVNSADFLDDGSRFEILPPSAATRADRDMRVMFHRTASSTGLVARFNDALEEYKSGDEYQRILEEMSSPRQFVVLVDVGNTVELHDASGSPWGWTLNGTRAVVTDWTPEPQDETFIEVKLLDGPEQGRVARVRAENVELPRNG